jgi:multidrug resistance protein, MATE family
VSELKTISRHAGTVLVGQLAVMAFGVADTMIAGRYSDQALAALSVGSAIYVSVYVGLIGIVQALLPVWAELRGAGKHEEVGRSLRQSLYLSSAIALVGMTALLFPGPLLRWAQVPELMLAEVQRYLDILAFAFAPALLFRLYSSFNQSLGRPLLVTWLQIGALVVKIPLSIWLVAGGSGIAPMGAAGCAWATLVVNYLLLVAAFLLLRTQRLYGPYQLWHAIEPPDWSELGRFMRLGLPAGLSYLVEVTSFTLMAVFIARLGVTASASHQIAASVATVMYMVPLSIGIASSARVSFWLGADQAERAREVVELAIKMTGAYAACLALCIFLARNILPGWYSDSPEVKAAASALLAWVALYHLADAAQAVSAFLLRSYRITVLPLVLYSVGLWGLGLFGGYRLTYEGLAGYAAIQAATGFWSASTFAILLVAFSFLLLLWRTLHARPLVGQGTS